MRSFLEAGFIFWGLFGVFGLIVVLYLLWMWWVERGEETVAPLQPSSAEDGGARPAAAGSAHEDSGAGP